MLWCAACIFYGVVYNGFWVVVGMYVWMVYMSRRLESEWYVSRVGLYIQGLNSLMSR